MGDIKIMATELIIPMFFHIPSTIFIDYPQLYFYLYMIPWKPIDAQTEKQHLESTLVLRAVI